MRGDPAQLEAQALLDAITARAASPEAVRTAALERAALVYERAGYAESWTQVQHEEAVAAALRSLVAS